MPGDPIPAETPKKVYSPTTCSKRCRNPERNPSPTSQKIPFRATPEGTQGTTFKKEDHHEKIMHPKKQIFR